MQWANYSGVKYFVGLFYKLKTAIFSNEQTIPQMAPNHLTIPTSNSFNLF
jgi:hypothetical protein